MEYDQMSVFGWIVITLLGLYALALLCMVIYLGPQLIREKRRKRARK